MERIRWFWSRLGAERCSQGALAALGPLERVFRGIVEEHTVPNLVGRM